MVCEQRPRGRPSQSGGVRLEGGAPNLVCELTGGAPRVNGGNRQGLVPGALRWNFKHYLSLVTFA